MSSRTRPPTPSAAGTDTDPPATGGRRRFAPIHRAWVVALVTGLTIVAAAAFAAMPGLLVDPLHTEYRWSRGAIGIASSVNMVCIFER